MTVVVFVVGAVVAAVLLGALVATLLVPSWRIWPTPGPGTWQSYVFWPLFRSLNVLVLRGGRGRPRRLSSASRCGCGSSPSGCAASIALFIYSFRVLGRDNSYGAQDGLVTGGIYRWTRNPQNAMLIVVYGCLAFAADSGPDLRAVRGHDGGLRPDGAGRGALARGRLRRALPALLHQRAPLLQLAPGPGSCARCHATAAMIGYPTGAPTLPSPLRPSGAWLRQDEGSGVGFQERYVR